MESDILERAKSLRHYLANKAEWKDESVIVGELIAEVERLRSQSVEQVFRRKNEEIAAKDARIAELEADRIEARAQYLLFMNDNPGCIAWNFDELDETEQDALREQARYMLELEEPWAYIQLREAREQIKRLEAAFLEATKEIVYATHEGRDAPEGEDVYAEKVAREALEQLRAEGKIGGGDGE